MNKIILWIILDIIGDIIIDKIYSIINYVIIFICTQIIITWIFDKLTISNFKLRFDYIFQIKFFLNLIIFHTVNLFQFNQNN